MALNLQMAAKMATKKMTANLAAKHYQFVSPIPFVSAITSAVAVGYTDYS
jgi:hypothetical protein